MSAEIREAEITRKYARRGEKRWREIWNFTWTAEGRPE
jgi:hypothetical protein